MIVILDSTSIEKKHTYSINSKEMCYTSKEIEYSNIEDRNNKRL